MIFFKTKALNSGFFLIKRHTLSESLGGKGSPVGQIIRKTDIFGDKERRTNLIITQQHQSDEGIDL